MLPFDRQNSRRFHSQINKRAHRQSNSPGGLVAETENLEARRLLTDITMNTVWSSNQALTEDVFIQSGATLTIQSGVQVTNGTGTNLITVQGGGQLVIEPSIGATQIDVDVEVQSGGTLQSESASITGDVRLLAGANLTLSSNNFQGSVTVGPELVPLLADNTLPTLINVTGGTVSQAIVWNVPGVNEYLLPPISTLSISGLNAELTIGAGTRLLATNTSTRVEVNNDGTLIVDGAEILADVTVGDMSPGTIQATGTTWNTQGNSIGRLELAEFANVTIDTNTFSGGSIAAAHPMNVPLFGTTSTLPMTVGVTDGIIDAAISWDLPGVVDYQVEVTSTVSIDGAAGSLTVAPGTRVVASNTSSKMEVRNDGTLTIDDATMLIEVQVGNLDVGNIQANNTIWDANLNSIGFLKLLEFASGSVTSNTFQVGAEALAHPEKVVMYEGDNILPAEMKISGGTVDIASVWQLDNVNTYRFQGNVIVTSATGSLLVKTGVTINNDDFSGSNLLEVSGSGSLFLDGIDLQVRVDLLDTGTSFVAASLVQDDFQISGAADVLVVENDFSNTTVTALQAPEGSDMIDLSNNFWGTASPFFAEFARIVDFDDNANLPDILVDTLIQPNELFGRAWEDLNTNATEDLLSDIGIVGAPVQLKDLLGNVIDSTVTDDNGYFRFRNVADGDYFYEITKPIDQRFVTPSVGTELRDNDSLLGGIRSRQITYNSFVDTHLVDIDFGLEAAAFIPIDSPVGYTNRNWWASVPDRFGIYRNVATRSPASVFQLSRHGDFNGDGLTDVAVWLNNGDWWIGTANSDGTFDFNLWGKWRTNDVKEIHVGDFNEDGLDDIIGLFKSGPKRGRWWVGVSDGSSLTNVNWGTYGNYDGISQVLVGNFDGVNGEDLAVVANTGVIWMVKTSNSSFQYLNANRWDLTLGVEYLQVGNYNGDLRDDILAVVGMGNNREVHVARSLGPVDGFETTIWSTIFFGISLDGVVSGDFNGDGRDDYMALLNRTAQWVAESNGTTFNNSVFWGSWVDAGPGLTDLTVGESNGDGVDDLFGRSLDGMWHASESDGSSFTVRELVQWSDSVTWDGVFVGLVGTFGAPPPAIPAAGSSTLTDSIESESAVISRRFSLAEPAPSVSNKEYGETSEQESSLGSIETNKTDDFFSAESLLDFLALGV